MTDTAIIRAFPTAILDAIAAWAESTTRPDAPRFDEYVQAKRGILDDFFTFVGKHPKDVAPADVMRWRDALAARARELEAALRDLLDETGEPVIDHPAWRRYELTVKPLRDDDPVEAARQALEGVGDAREG